LTDQSTNNQDSDRSGSTGGAVIVAGP